MRRRKAELAELQLYEKTFVQESMIAKKNEIRYVKHLNKN